MNTIKYQCQTCGAAYALEEALRDTFAAAALTGILSNPNTNSAIREHCTQVAYELADHMLEARRKQL